MPLKYMLKVKQMLSALLVQGASSGLGFCFSFCVMCYNGISNVPELLWRSLFLKVSRGFQKGGKAKIDVAIVLNKALSKSQLPNRGALPL